MFRDPVSAVSHFLMTGIAIVITAFLWRLTSHDRRRARLVLVFGCSMVALYFSSGIYHASNGSAETLAILQKLDLSAIYILIAGTATPIAGLTMPYHSGRRLLFVVWSLACIGIVGVWSFEKPAPGSTVGLYALLAFVALMGFRFYFNANRRGMKWLIGGCAIYIAGGAIDALRVTAIWPGVIGHHEILHFCDILGTSCHVIYIVGILKRVEIKLLRSVESDNESHSTSANRVAAPSS
jgi:hemolysin III